MGILEGHLADDIWFALRTLKRRPASPLLALGLLAFAIGASTTLFTVAYGVLIRPLTWPASDRLVSVSDLRKASQDRTAPTISNMSYLAWTSGASTIDGLAIWSAFEDELNIGGDVSRAEIASVSPNFFQVLGVHALRGSLLVPGDGMPGGRRVAILSYGLWRDRFGARGDVLGSTILIGRKAHTVIGVMPQSFAYPTTGTSVWREIERVDHVFCGPGCRSFTAYQSIARLKAGVTAEQAASEATSRVRQADRGELAAFSDDDRPLGIAVVPLLAATTAAVKSPIMTFLVAVSLLLVTAIWNVAGMQLARGLSRRREVAIRSALGGSAKRLVRQFLIESSCIGLAAGVLGVLFAALACRLLPALLPPTFPRSDNIAVTSPVLAFALFASLLSSVGIGLLPALSARRPDIVQGLAPHRR